MRVLAELPGLHLSPTGGPAVNAWAEPDPVTVRTVALVLALQARQDAFIHFETCPICKGQTRADACCEAGKMIVLYADAASQHALDDAKVQALVRMTGMRSAIVAQAFAVLRASGGVAEDGRTLTGRVSLSLTHGMLVSEELVGLAQVFRPFLDAARPT